jgi:hypothetical protein
MQVPQWIKRICSQVPIIGSLPQTRSRDHIEAVRELVISLLISMAPVWVGTLVLRIGQTFPSQLSYLQCARTVIQNGELFIYSATTLAPVMYIVTRDRFNVRSFPGKYTFISVVIIFAFISTGIFTMQRMRTQILAPDIITLSLWLYVIAVTVFYFALVYNNTFLPNPADLMREEEGDYVNRLRRHRQ